VNGRQTEEGREREKKVVTLKVAGAATQTKKRKKFSAENF
jgi:hypothetical protein